MYVATIVQLTGFTFGPTVTLANNKSIILRGDFIVMQKPKRLSHIIGLVTLVAVCAVTPLAHAIETDIVERVKDIFPGRGTSGPSGLDNINGTLYFAADDGTNGEELWKSDGTEAGTVMVKDINSAGDAFDMYMGTSITNVNGTLFFAAYNDSNGRELWKSDGTTAGTVIVKDIMPGSGGSLPSWIVNVNGTAYFNADDGNNGVELWKSDGTEAGTVLVKDIFPGGNSYPSHLTEVNGTLYFSANNGLNGVELWKSDGSENGTVMVKNIHPAGSSEPRNLTNVSGTLFFQADNQTNGFELWKSDGSESGTMMVKNINQFGGSSSIGELTNVAGILFFRANDANNGLELWTSDGTAGGTVMVRDIAPGAGSSTPRALTNVNGTLYFDSDDGTNGVELWKSDGTAAGTVTVKNIYPGGSSFPGWLTNVNGTLYFGANNGINGYELWKTDGSETGTVLVKDINTDPGVNGGSGSVGSLTNVNGVLYFEANDGVSSWELWRAYVRTDTPPVFDDVPTPHPFYSAITNFAVSGYTSGCRVTPSLYCPNDPVTRAQMAVFLNRGVNGQDFTPEPATGTVFDDVPIGTFADAWIETFKELQITGGCSANPPLYCPDDPITRSQMTVFLLKVIHGSAYNAPPATGTAFADVSSTDFAANWIEQLAKENITGGCGNGDFCPNDAVTRGQMAAFLTRVFHTPMLFE